MTTVEASKAYAGWAIVELMGHVRLAGRVSEEPMFGTALLRIDVPDGDSYTTQYASGGSIYRLTPCSEEVARAVVGSSRPMPIEPWEMRRLEAPRERVVEVGQDACIHEGGSCYLGTDDEPTDCICSCSRCEQADRDR
jgi:hypothetical protein